MYRTEKETKLKELFNKLVSAHKWMERNPDEVEECEGLIERSVTIYDELEKLGVSREFGECVLIFGPHVSGKLVNQFLEEPK